MGTGKTYSTKYLLDSNNNSGADGQVLISTSTGIDWVDANTVPGIIGGPFLPLTAGSTVPLTGDLYLESSSTDVVMSGNTSGAFTIDNNTGQIGFLANGSTVQSMIITSSQISLNEAVTVNSTSLSSPNKLQVNGQARVIGQFMVGDSSAGNVAARPIHVKQSGAATIRLEDSDSDNLAFDLIVDEGVGFKIAETIGGDAGDDTRLTIHETSGNVSIGSTTEEGRLLIADSGLGSTDGDSVTNTVMMGGRWDLLFKQIRTANETDWNNTTVRLQGRVDSTNMQSIDFATDDSYNRHIDINTASNSFNTRFTHGGNVGVGTVSPNFRLGLSNAAELTSVYQQFTNGTTGVQSSDGTVMGIDADGDFIINNQEAKEIKLYTSDSQKVTIDSGGNVGINDTSPTAKLDVGGSVQGSSFYNLANPSPIMFPDGGTYNGTSSETGYIVIKLPDTGGAGQNNMMTCLVRIFDYATNESFDVRFNGYFYGSTYLWTRTSVWIDSSANIDRNFTVRFGKELGSSGNQDRAVVTIGEASGTWSYPKVAVIQYTPGHSEGTQPQIWNSGWNVSVVADYWDGTDNTLDDTIINNQINNWRRNGQDLYYGSGTGNVGIGVTNPGVKLQVLSASEQLTNFSSSTADQLAYSQINASSSTTGTITAAAALELVGQADGSGHGRHAWIGAEGTSNTTFETKLKFKIRGETASGYDWSGSAEAPTIMTLEGDGNVGIGTTSPDYLLDLYKSTGTSTSTTGTTLQRLWNYVGSDIKQQKTFIDFVFQDDNANEYPQVRIGAEVGQNGDANTQIKEGSGAFVVYTNNATGDGPGTPTGLAERFRVDYSGNVGIGETNPAVPLHISRDNSTQAENIALILDNNATEDGTQIGMLFRCMTGGANTDFEIYGEAQSSNTMDLVFESDGSVERMRLKADGDLQISRYLEHLGDTNSYLGWSAADDFRIYTGGRELLRLDEGTDPDVLNFMSTNFSMSTGGELKLLNNGGAKIIFSGNGANPTSTEASIYDQSGVGLTLSAHNVSIRNYDGTNMIESARFVHDKLTCAGDVIGYGSPSDVRLKENIKPIESALDKVSKLQGVTFDWKKSDSILDIKKDVGFIAQDVQKVVPELVRENSDGMLSMRHQGITPILLEAIKELKAEIEDLKKKIK